MPPPRDFISVALDSNENAFGPSPKARAAALAATDHLERYLENPAHILVPALASCYGLEEDRIAIGFGSDDLTGPNCACIFAARHGVVAKSEQLSESAKLRL